jgi:hypothetical protein
MTTVTPVIAVLTNRVPKLKNFETLGIELKIATNLEGVNINFPNIKHAYFVTLMKYILELL